MIAVADTLNQTFYANAGEQLDAVHEEAMQCELDASQPKRQIRSASLKLPFV